MSFTYIQTHSRWPVWTQACNLPKPTRRQIGFGFNLVSTILAIVLFAPLSWFPPVFPPVYVVLVVFTSLLSHIQMATLCLFVLSKRQKPKFWFAFPILPIITAAVAHRNFPHMLSRNHTIWTEKKDGRKRLSLAGSPRLTILQLLCTKQQNVGNEVWKIPGVDAAGSFGLWRQCKQNSSEEKYRRSYRGTVFFAWS